MTETDTPNEPQKPHQLSHAPYIQMFPTNTAGACTCSKGAACASPGKHVAVKFKDNAAPGCTLRNSRFQFKTSNWGWVTGSVSGLVVIDVDCKPGKADGWETLAQELPDLPPTFSIQSPSGEGAGAHLVYKLPPGFKPRTSFVIGKSLDFKGEHGYVIAPGSVGANGNAYAIYDDREPVELPAEYLPRFAEVARGESNFDATDTHWPTDEEAARALDYVLQYPPAIEGEKGGTNTFLLCQKLIRGMQLDPNFVHTLIMEHYSPRCDPPWDDAGIEHKINQAIEKGTFEKDPEPWDVEETARIAGAATQSRVQREADQNVDETGKFQPCHLLAADSKLEPITLSEAGYLLLNHAKWKGVISYDKFLQECRVQSPPFAMDLQTKGYTAVDESRLVMWFEAQQRSITPPNATRAFNAAAGSRETDSLLEYFDALPACDVASSEAAIKEFCVSCLNIEDPLQSEFVMRWLIGAVRRARNPGTQMDTTIVFVGPQGARKSTLLRELCPKPEWFRDDIPSMADRDGAIALVGKFIVEFSELAGVVGKEVEPVKAFLTRAVDNYRQIGTKEMIRLPRRNVFAATTNTERFLHDTSGARRFWPVVVHKILVAWLTVENRTKLWAAANALEAAGVPHWIDDEARSDVADLHANHTDEDPWVEVITGLLIGRGEWLESATSIALQLFEDPSRVTHKDVRRVGACLRKIGCMPWVKRLEGGKLKRGYRVPDEIAKRPERGDDLANAAPPK